MNDPSQQTTPSRFSNREEIEQIREYRRFNAASALAFVLGIGSIGSLASPKMWVVPFVAVIVGAVGIWLANRRDNVGGRGTAWAGIFLALFFVSMAASRFYFERTVLYSEAEIIGKKWLSLVAEGEDEIAHQAMMHPSQRQAAGFSVDEYYAMDKTQMAAKNKTFAASPAKDVLQLGADAVITLTKNLNQNVDLKYGKLIMQNYRVTAPDKDPVDVKLIIARSYKDDLERATWIIADILPPD